jgi:hypothetical protein
MTDPGVNYAIRFPDSFDDDEWEVAQKGYFDGLVVEHSGRIYQPVFYDKIRLGQAISEALRSPRACFTEGNLVVIETVDRGHIESSIRWLAGYGFRSLTPRSSL